ncbi:hypothetical protein YC2023_118185 [Brassica napus]
MSRPPTANEPPTPALSAHGPHPIPTVGALMFHGSKSLFTDHAITTRPFPVFWSHSHGIANHFPIHPSFHYSNSSTLNSGVLNGCVTEKISQLWFCSKSKKMKSECGGDGIHQHISGSKSFAKVMYLGEEPAITDFNSETSITPDEAFYTVVVG